MTRTRIDWLDLPTAVRAWVEESLGAPVVEAVSQPGGFSPGTADRVVTGDGRRAFVKAVSSAQNDRSPGIHRREVAVTSRLPDDPHLPRLLHAYDDGDWVALVLEDVEGRHPVTPWRCDELDATLAAFAALAERGTPCPVPDLPTGPQEVGEAFGGFARLRAEPRDDVERGDPWIAAHLDLLCDLAARATAASAGDTLAHTDVRSDNLLVRPDGSVAIVDWPWACRAAPWVDTFLLLADVNRHGGHDVDALASEHLEGRLGLDPDDLTAAVAGLAGYFVEVARQPPPPGLPTVRAAQAAQAGPALAWLHRRLGTGR